MKLKTHLVTVPWLGLALAAGALVAPPSLAQEHPGAGVETLATGAPNEDGNVPAAQAIHDAQLQYGSAAAAHWVLYQRLRVRNAPVLPPGADCPGEEHRSAPKSPAGTATDRPDRVEPTVGETR